MCCLGLLRLVFDSSSCVTICLPLIRILALHFRHSTIPFGWLNQIVCGDYRTPFSRREFDLVIVHKIQASNPHSLSLSHPHKHPLIRIVLLSAPVVHVRLYLSIQRWYSTSAFWYYVILRVNSLTFHLDVCILLLAFARHGTHQQQRGTKKKAAARTKPTCALSSIERTCYLYHTYMQQTKNCRHLCLIGWWNDNGRKSDEKQKRSQMEFLFHQSERAKA